MSSPVYLCIDLKSFYASVECVARGLDPLKARLLVADEGRTDGTICLAVSPALKALGVPGRPRLFEAKQAIRLAEAQLHRKIDYLVARPRMRAYIECSAKIYAIYLRWFSPEDIHVYSIDEVFIDLTPYQSLYRIPPRDLAVRVIHQVLRETGITATCGIGPNLYLAKVAMDIVAKHLDPDDDGVRIAQLDELSYRRLLWDHLPITDFWQIAGGISRRLARYGMRTMGDVAAMSLQDEEFLYRLFGINAELLIDHAWGLEPCTMYDIKHYRPDGHSASSGQVLPRAYAPEEALLAVKEQAEVLSLRLLEERRVGSSLTLCLAYEALPPGSKAAGPCHPDRRGRLIPDATKATYHFEAPTNRVHLLLTAAAALFRKALRPGRAVRRIFLTMSGLQAEDEVPVQLSLFTDQAALDADRSLEQAILSIKSKYGPNSLLRGMSYLSGGRTRERNLEIGGHRA